MTYELSDSGISDTRAFDTGGQQTTVRLVLRELRRERTGMHGIAAILEGGKVLAHDNFNLGRSEDRRRLVKAAHHVLSRLVQESLPAEGLQYWLDDLCLYATTQWEVEKYQVEKLSGEVGKRVMLLSPHVEQGTGTIVFAPPGAGKSWLMLCMSISLNTGKATIWGTTPSRDTLYVDLERNKVFFRGRLAEIESALGLEPSIELPYLRARGIGLPALRKLLRKWSAEHPGGVILYDSISRVGMGSLIEDDVANGIIDLANGCSETWVALAHSPRGDANHQFGSVHFDAGADTIIRLTSQEKQGALGCCLRVTKSNHQGRVLPTFYSLTFNGDCLQGIKTASAEEWPELVDNKDVPPGDLIAAYLRTAGESKIADILKATGLPYMSADRIMKADHRFTAKSAEKGNAKLWDIQRGPHLVPK